MLTIVMPEPLAVMILWLLLNCNVEYDYRDIDFAPPPLFVPTCRQGWPLQQVLVMFREDRSQCVTAKAFRHNAKKGLFKKDNPLSIVRNQYWQY
jgi:hypothetical protein